MLQKQPKNVFNLNIVNRFNMSKLRSEKTSSAWYLIANVRDFLSEFRITILFVLSRIKNVIPRILSPDAVNFLVYPKLPLKTIPKDYLTSTVHHYCSITASHLIVSDSFSKLIPDLNTIWNNFRFCRNLKIKQDTKISNVYPFIAIWPLFGPSKSGERENNAAFKND
jgi:hypothetical protein